MEIRILKHQNITLWVLVQMNWIVNLWSAKKRRVTNIDKGGYFEVKVLS